MIFDERLEGEEKVAHADNWRKKILPEARVRHKITGYSRLATF